MAEEAAREAAREDTLRNEIKNNAYDLRSRTWVAIAVLKNHPSRALRIWSPKAKALPSWDKMLTRLHFAVVGHNHMEGRYATDTTTIRGVLNASYEGTAVSKKLGEFHIVHLGFVGCANTSPALA
jgi:hypothetical protein